MLEIYNKDKGSIEKLDKQYKATTKNLDKCLEALAIKDLADKKVSTLSGGEKSRVSIARALMADYDILLLDEPFNGLDDTTKDNVIKYIKEKTAHKTVLLVTHNKDEASFFA